jgi:cytochrome c-type biogenesis protein CcmH/NrfG
MAASGNGQEAIKEFEFILRENPEFVPAYSNLGYIRLTMGQSAEALRLYKMGEELDPDNEALLLNLAGYFSYMKDQALAKKYLERILAKDPGNQKVKSILKQLSR